MSQSMKTYNLGVSVDVQEFKVLTDMLHGEGIPFEVKDTASRIITFNDDADIKKAIQLSERKNIITVKA
ncbi:hypothetical protein DPMN_168845 [Dreissena polymorpha]|uniref:Uncharacterized protein n=1 Tax=Dreissena polymorpha TaxID=45954 RepID=A0A9D4IXM0_DREPO|nr:hypothetical protein DPMN_168845 [Dreissena polymorpha]